MWNDTPLTQLFGIKYPIIQAPMAGGATTPELVATVSNHGGLGSLGAGYLSASALKSAISAISAIRQLTTQPFAVNLFIPRPHTATNEQMLVACDAINTCASELKIVTQPLVGPYLPSFDDQVCVLLEEKVPIISWTFGMPNDDIIKQFKNNNTLVVGTATTLAEALALQKKKVDAIVVQGAEAGGHRGTFLDSDEVSLIPLRSLISQLAANFSVPIIASGGIMTGQQIDELLLIHSVAAVQLGTAFLCSHESGISTTYKKTLLKQSDDQTVLTRAFSGKLARGISNQFTDCMQSKGKTLLDYPIQNKLTGLMRKAAKQACNSDYMSLWAGQGVHLIAQNSAENILKKLISEVNEHQL